MNISNIYKQNFLIFLSRFEKDKTPAKNRSITWFGYHKESTIPIMIIITLYGRIEKLFIVTRAGFPKLQLPNLHPWYRQYSYIHV